MDFDEDTILMAFPQNLRLQASVIPRAFDWLSHAVIFYAIPTAIAVISLAALFLWEDVYSVKSEYAVDIQVLPPASDGVTEVADAKQKLATLPTVRIFNTQLSERPVWFQFHIRETSVAAPLIVEFPSRHAIHIACWDGDSLLPIGDSKSISPGSAIYPVKSGFALKLQAAHHDVICRSSFVGPARLTADLWLAKNLEIANRDFHRKSGLIDGGLLVLAAFVLISALLNRRGLYLIFAAWLVVTVRLSATSGGWDDQWLNHAVPVEWLSSGRSFTRAAWALLTVSIFRNLFHEDLIRLRFAFPISILQWLCVLLFVAAAFLPRSIFVPTMWGLGAVWLPFFLYSLAVIVIKTKKIVALLYAASLTVTITSTLLDLLAASLGTTGLNNSINGVVVSLASGLLISLAIAEQLRQEHKEKLSMQAQLQHTYDSIPIGMFTLDLNGKFTSINPALRNILGSRAFKSKSNTWQQYFGANVWHRLYNLVHERQDGEIEIQSQMDITGNQGPRRYLVQAALAGDKIEGSLQDVTEKSVAADELSFLADNDALTKVLNRRGIEKVFNEAVQKINEDHPLALAYLDLDRFKLINDLYGHNAGDEVLRQVCQRINDLLSKTMRLGRVGGDEFVILLPDTRMPPATVLCRGIVDSIDDRPFRVGEKAFYVRGSIGLIEVSPGSTMKEVLSTSDRACREAKMAQHRGLVVYEQASPAYQEHQAEIQLIGEISTSEFVKGLYLEMQPIMSLSRPNEALNFEVLLRMRDAAGKNVPVGRVIAAAEHSGRMSLIDRWVMTSTLAWLDANRDRLSRTQFVCVNLSGSSLNDEQFMNEVFTILGKNSHVSGYLSIEITESVALHDLKNTRRFIDKVRSFGARVALDDFGAGYTSFSYLKELPADLLKIDGSFVVNMNQHPANISIVEAIVNLARNLGMKTIAEWAEDAATVQTLAEIGVDYVQGFIVARPMAPETLIAAESSASFIKSEELLQFVNALERQNNTRAQMDMLIENDKQAPPKIH